MHFVVANLKMKLVSAEENERYLEAFRKEYRSVSGVRMIVCPSFPYIAGFEEGLPKEVAVGAQDVFSEERGSYTGAVSPISLRDFGVKFCIVGHSERRECGEKDSEIAKKLSACFRNDIRPILCVGETEAERGRGETARTIRTMLEGAMANISAENFRYLIIAYEPRWAIGSDRTPSSDDILEVAISIRKYCVGRFDRNDVDTLPILYGGSVTPETVRETCLRPGLSGALVGRESLVPRELMNILKAFHGDTK